MRGKRIAIVGTVGIVIALGAVWFLVAPTLIRDRATRALARFGRARVDGASLRLSTVELTDVSIEQNGLSLTAHTVLLSTGFFGWLGGRESVRDIRVDGYAADVDIARMAELRRAASSTAKASAAGNADTSGEWRKRVQLDLRGGHVALRAGDAESIYLSNVAVTGSPRDARVTIGVARMGGSVTCAAHDAMVKLEDGRPVLAAVRKLEVEAADVTGLSGTEGGSLLSRVRAWSHAFRRARGEPTVPASPQSEVVRELIVEAVTVRTGADEWVDELSFRVVGSSERFSVTAKGRARDGLIDVELAFEPKRFIVNGNVALRRLPLALFAPFVEGVSFVQLSDARASAELNVAMRSDLQIDLTGSLGVENAELRSHRLANHPIRGVTFEVRGQATVRPLSRSIEVTKSVLTLGRVSIPISARLEVPAGAFVLNARAVLPATPCEEVVHALPADLLGDTAQFHFGGAMGGEIVATIDSRNYDATVFRVRVEDGCEFLGAPAMAALTRFDGTFVHEAIEPDGSRVVLETGPGSAEWTPITQISPFFLHAVLAHEDAAFFRHSGFAPLEIQTALIRNLKAGRYVQGASTITMQLVKNVFLNREKTLSRKVQEALLTWWIERNMPKHRMLELYVNVIEYGPRIYGVRQASEYYFGRAPSELSAAESAFLACILPNPKAFHTLFEQGRITPNFAEKMRRLLARMRERGRIDAVAFAEAMAQMATFRFHALGTEPPQPRSLRGTAASLPLGGIGISYSDDGGDAAEAEEETSFDTDDWSQ